MPDLYRLDIAQVDLEKPVKQSYVGEALITGDKDANRYGAEVYRGEKAVDLTGCTVEGWFIAPSGETIIIPGEINGNTAFVDITSECYSTEGAFTLAIKIKSEDIVATVRMIDGNIRKAYSYINDVVSEIGNDIVDVVIAAEGSDSYDIAYVTMGHDGIATMYNASCKGPMTITCVHDTLLCINSASNMQASNLELLNVNGHQFLYRVTDANGVISVGGGSVKVESLSAGEVVYIAESSGNVAYRLVDKDYNGQGLALLVREECAGTCKFWSEQFDYDMYHKYDGSLLDAAMTNFYSALPSNTRSKIALATIPVRSSALSGASQDWLDRYMFALSATEWGLSGSAYEGEIIEDASKRNIGVTYWTREPVGGMRNYSYTVNASGTKSNALNTVAQYYRPAFCITLDKSVAMVDGGWALQ